MVATGIGVGLYLAFGPSGDGVMDPALLGGASILQILGIGLLSLQLARFLRSALESDEPLGRFIGLRTAAWPWFAGAAIGAATVWTFPSWIATQLTTLLGWDGGAVAKVNEALQGPLADSWLLIVAVGVSAPVVEEIIFRGYVWTVAERIGSSTFAFMVSTLLFCAYHMEPVHVVSLLPTAAFLGFLRLKSGSVWPCVVAHLVNNGLAILTARMGATDPTAELPLWAALGGLAVTLAVAVAALRASPPR